MYLSTFPAQAIPSSSLRRRLGLLIVLGLLGLPACGDDPASDDDDSAVSNDDDSAAGDDDDSAASDDDDSTADDDDSSSGDDDDSAVPGGYLPGSLVVTEIFPDPVGKDQGREWFEVFNPGVADVDMEGWVLEDIHTNSYVIAESLVVPSGGFAVLGESTDPINLGTPVDYAYGLDVNGFPLGNNTDEVVLFSPGGVLIDAVHYDGGGQFPSAVGRSIQLDPGAFNSYANDMGWNWCLSTGPLFTTQGDQGTPGAPNTDC